MTTEKRDVPRTQTSAPVKPSRTTEDPGRARDPDSERTPPREAGDEETVRGDRMPKGADEPGAGM